MGRKRPKGEELIRRPVDEVEKRIINVLHKIGCSDHNSLVTAEVLLEGDLRGHINHGMNRLGQILEGVENGTINVKAEPKIIKNHKGIAVIDARYGLGYPVGKSAMELAVDKAKEFGIGAVGVINGSHLGVMSYYSEIASKKECIGIAMTTSSPAVVLNGGKTKVLGTNPFSYSMPHKDFPVTADFSTAQIPRGLVYQHLREGKKLPENCAVDKNGNPTTDPQEALDGGLLAFGNGEMRGSFLNILISILCGATIGGVNNPNINGTRYMDRKPNKGDFFIAIDVSKMTDKDYFTQKINDFFQFIEDQEIEFRIPNERSFKTKKMNLKNGVKIPKKTLKIFKEYEKNGNE